MTSLFSEEAKSPSIFLAMPVYGGRDYLDETLRSIRNQEFEDFRLLISIDGGDEQSAAVCANYLDDSRFGLFLQDEHLGWARNLNWLMAQCNGTYFCYWQQDDLCSTSYLRALYEHVIQHPEASCTYADVQWFGSRVDRWHLPSVTGPSLKRVLSQLENGYSEIMGLIRRSALEAAGPLRINAYDSRLEDFVWAAKLAREGELHHVPGPLYFKRAHSANTHSFSPCPNEWLPGVWKEYGLGLLEAALPLMSGPERLHLLWRVLERLILSRPERWMAFEPSRGGANGLISFANEFLEAAVQRFGVDEWKQVRRFPDPQTLIEILDARYSAFERTAPDSVLLGLRCVS
jgi:glycosyltransferase involved in cell wall biosynthesis